MPGPIPARCDGRFVLAEVASTPCTRTAPNVLAYVCAAGHEGVIRACDPHGLRIITGQDAQPATHCPTCQQSAWFVVYCGRCRRGEHDKCHTYAGSALAGQFPRRAEEHCACTCNPDDPKVPGVPGARQYRDEVKP